MPNPKALRHLLTDEQTAATTMLVIADDRLTPATPQEGETLFTEWDPETVIMELEQETQVTLPPINRNRLMAALMLVQSDAFYKDLHTFELLCNALTDGTFDPTVYDPAEPDEIAWGITEALLIWPPDNPQEPFAPEILGYIGATLQRAGLAIPPDVLRLGDLGGEMWQQVQSQFSDDPLLFAAIYQAQHEETDEINAFVKHRLRQVLQQLDSLQLESEGTESTVQRMLAGLEEARRQGETLPSAGP